MFYKLDELRALTVALKPSFICITESWLTPDIDNNMISIDGYCIFRNDRRDDIHDNRRGGGTLIYAASNTSSVCVLSDFAKPSGIECTLIKFEDCLTLTLSYLLCTYVPPGIKSETFVAFKQFVINTLDFLLTCSPNSEVFVCGDLNRYDFSFLDQEFNLCNIVNKPTLGNAVLDKFFCSTSISNNYDVMMAPPSV